MVAELPYMIYFLPMRVVFVAFPGCNALDVSGPAEVFAAAARDYEIVVGSTRGGPIETTAGYAIVTEPIAKLRPTASDTILVVGGDREGVAQACGDAELLRWLSRASRVARRIGSICTGAFVLSATGVFDGKRVATHWSAVARLERFRAAVQVDREAIFVEDGRWWSSAGVTTGIDMALAMVEADHDRKVADAVAAELVLYTRRHGFQSQWSDALVAQLDEPDALATSIAWGRGHLGELDVPRLAKRAGMSVRSLHRRCLEHLQLTPAKLIERLRVEHARTLLAARKRQAKAIARSCGFGSTARMAAAFHRALGVSPTEYKRMFAAA